jgi:hypothetical protein
LLGYRASSQETRGMTSPAIVWEGAKFALPSLIRCSPDKEHPTTGYVADLVY